MANTARIGATLVEVISTTPKAPRIGATLVEVISTTPKAPRIGAVLIEVITSTTAPEVPGGAPGATTTPITIGLDRLRL